MKNSNRKPNILNKEYNKVLKNKVDVPEDRWATYDEIIAECVGHLGEVSFDEIKYKITDGVDINEVMLSMLDKLSNGGYFLKLRRDINAFINEDWIYKYTNFKKK